MKAFAKNLLLFTSLLTVQAIEGQTTESAWNYPAQPGTTEWSKIKTKKEKIDVKIESSVSEAAYKCNPNG